MNKKFVNQVGNNKKVILWCTANQISRIVLLCHSPKESLFLNTQNTMMYKNKRYVGHTKNNNKNKQQDT